MSKDNVVDLNMSRPIARYPLREMLRVGAQQLIQQAVEVELQGLLAKHADCRTTNGAMLVW